METTASKIVKNTGIIILGNIAGIFVGLLTNIFVVRYLGASLLGVYSFIFAYLGFFGIVLDLGVSSILVREISKDVAQAPRILGNAIIIKTVLAVLAALLSCLIISFLKYPLDTKVMVYIASLSFFFFIGGLYRIVFQVNLNMQYSVLADLLNVLCKLSLTVYLIAHKADLAWFVAAEVASNIPGTFLAWRASLKFILPKIEIDLALCKFLFKEALPLAISSVFSMVFLRIGQLMLFNMQGASSLGYYAPAVKLTEMFNMIPAAFMMSVFPLFSRYSGDSKESLAKVYDLSAKYLMAFIIPAAAAITLISTQVMVLFYGQAFAPSSPALAVLMWAEVFTFAGIVNNRLLISVNKQWMDFIFTSAAAVVNVGLNLVLIPKYGFMGASIATLAAYSLGPALNCALKAIRLYSLRMFGFMVRPAIASLIMIAVVYGLRSSLLYFLLAAPVVYIAAMFLLKGFDIVELKVIFQKKG